MTWTNITPMHNTSSNDIMRARENKTRRKAHLDNFHIAGFGYWEGCEAFEQLKIGSELELVREGAGRYL